MLTFRWNVLVLCVLAGAAAAQDGLKIVVLEGDGAINNIREHSARAPVIRVEDSGDPVNNASVDFVLPQMGAGGTFDGGLSTLTTETGPDGRAVARGLRPNNVPGEFRIKVSAFYRGRTATAVITQTNAAPAVSHGLRKKLIIAGVAGGALAAVLAAVAGGGGAAAGATAAAPGSGSGTVITPGAPSFGPPH